MITLGIIGIVAAMTLPTLINNYQKKETVSKLKKVYSTLQQATLFAVGDNGEVKDWDYSLDEEEFMNIYYAPYLKVIVARDVLSHTYTTLSGSIATKSRPTLILMDGAYIWVEFHRSFVNPFHIVVDINGKQKPNKVGRDLFVFSIQNNRLVTYNHYDVDVNLITNRTYLLGRGTSGQCNVDATGGLLTGGGSYCSRVIEMDGWEIKDDYPW